MNYAQIRENDVANGLGVRVSIFLSGCYFNCFNCFNKEYQNFDFGTPYTTKTSQYIVEHLQPKYIKGLSILGGEPLEHTDELKSLLPYIRQNMRDEQDIWMWSGYKWEDIIQSPDKLDVISYLDILVDGQFKQELKDLNLKFRGSSNQRIIDVQNSLKYDRIILFDE